MEFISERIGYNKADEDLTVYIKASTKNDAKKIRFLKIWVILWGISGLFIVSQLFLPYADQQTKIFLFGYLAFWAYFFYIAAKAYYFRKYGTETVYINNNKFMIRRDIYTKKGKPKWFVAENKNPFNIHDEKAGSLSQLFYSSFWVTSGGSVTFGSDKNNYRFGLQLKENEAKKLVQLLNKSIKAQPKNK